MANIVVGAGGFETIQEAIDAASDGDHITVSAGDYDAFTVDKAVTIEGEGLVRIIGSFRADNGIELNTSVATWLTEAFGYDGSSGAGVEICSDGVTLSNLIISSFTQGVVFDGADDLVLNNLQISDTIIGVLKDGDYNSTGFRMNGGSISGSYLGISIETGGNEGPPIFIPVGASAIVESVSSAFDDVIIDGVNFTDLTFKGIYADALSNAQLLNLVMTNVGQFGQAPAFGPPWEIGHHAGGIDINIDSGFFDNILINGFVMHDVGAGSAPNSDGAAITIRSSGEEEYNNNDTFAPPAEIPPLLGSVVISNGIIQGTTLGYRLGTFGEQDDIWADVSVQNVLVNGYLIGTLDNQSTQTLLVTGTSQGDFLDAADTTDGRLMVYGVDGNDRIIGGTYDDLLDGGTGNDFIYTRKGVDTVLGGLGNDGVYFGAYFNQGGGPSQPSILAGGNALEIFPPFHPDEADGGVGTDTFALQGNYYFTNLARVTNFEALLLVSGSNPDFDFVGGRQVIVEDGPPEFALSAPPPPEADPQYFYNISPLDTLVAPGIIFTVIGSGLQVGETLIFNGSHEHDGAFRIFAGEGLNVLTGGDGNDGFLFGGNPFGILDFVDGGDGIDLLAFRGDYAGSNAIELRNTSLVNTEVVVLLTGHGTQYGGVLVPGGFDYDLTTADGNVAAGKQLLVIATSLGADETLAFDGSAETNGSFSVMGGAGADQMLGGENNDVLYGGLGADSMTGGNGADTYLYRSAAELTSAQTDTIDFSVGDKIDLSAIAGATAFSFLGDGAFTNVANQLRVFETGGHWVVQGDVTGDGLADLVISVNAPDGLEAASFVL